MHLDVLWFPVVHFHVPSKVEACSGCCQISKMELFAKTVRIKKINRLKITTDIILKSNSFSVMLSSVLINMFTEKNISFTIKVKNDLLSYYT